MRFQDDPSMIKKRLHYRWIIEHQLRDCYQGDLALLVKLVVSERWVHERTGSYGYELAWLFDKDRGTIGHALINMEEKGKIERTKNSGRRVLFKPSESEESRYRSHLDRHQEELEAWFDELHQGCPCHSARGIPTP